MMWEEDSVDAHNGDDHVREALNRLRFEERVAHGYVEDEEILLQTQLEDAELDNPAVLFVHAGGEFEEYKQGVGPDYTGGEFHTVSFEHVHEVEQAFERLVEEYELQEYGE